MALSRQSKKNPPGSLGSTSSNSSVPGAPNRISFAKLREPLEVPGLLDVQTDSFEWLIGAPHWREAAAARGDTRPVGGLEEVLYELSPIEDFSGSLPLSFESSEAQTVSATLGLTSLRAGLIAGGIGLALEEQAGVAGVVGERLAECSQQLLEALSAGELKRPLGGRDDVPQRQPEQLVNERVLAGEPPVDGTDADAGPANNL